MVYLCPCCTGSNISCRICDGGKYVTKNEAKAYLERTAREFQISLPSQKRNKSELITIEIDLSELDMEESIL